MISRFFLLTVFALTISQITFAEENTVAPTPERLHSIELIVFKYNQLDNANTEFWKPATPLLINNALEVNSNPSLFTLNNEKTKIANNNKYTVLLHLAWKQKLTATDKLIHIHGGKTYDLQGREINEVDGTVSVSKNKFVKISTNLFLTEPGNGLASFPMRSTRNTKENELNYFDNPAFGMLIKVKSPT